MKGPRGEVSKAVGRANCFFINEVREGGGVTVK